MKKTVLILIIILSLLTVPVVVLAQNRRQATGQQLETKNKGIKTAVQNLNRVVERNNNPKTGQQIRSMVQNHQKVQTKTTEALRQMNHRNQVIKLLVGPDYKNAGQVRSEIVGLRNDIRQLEQIKDGSSSPDAGDIQGAINDLQIEADGLETQLVEQLSGFSLFGWLAKLLAK